MGLGLNYQFSDKLKHKSGTNSSGTAYTASQLDAETNDKGLKNIELNARFRAMEEAPVTLDVIAGVSVKVSDDEKSKSYTNASNVNVAEDGNAYGPSSVNVGTEIGKKHGDFQWKTALGVNYFFKGDLAYLKADTNASNTAVDMNSSKKSATDFYVGFAGEYHLVPSFALGAKANFDFVGERKETIAYLGGAATSTPYVITDDSHTDITVGLEGKYEVTQSIVGKLGFDYKILSDFDRTSQSGSSAATKEQMKDRSDMRFALGMDFSF